MTVAQAGVLSLLWLSSLSVASVTTPNAQDDSLKFLVLGDWGGRSKFPFVTAIEKAVSARMANVAASKNTQFTLSLGDNFYSDGVRSVDDKRFKQTFESVFDAPSLQTKWHVVAGNHDHYGNVTAQIAYSASSSRWSFPDYYYTMTYSVPQAQATVQFVMLDTVLLCGNTRKGTVGTKPVGPEDKQVAEDQWAWLENTLSSSRANYLIVAGHYPVFSVAEHGPTQLLVSRLQPLLYKYRVSAYFAGHDHNLQHFQNGDRTWTTNFFVVGCANFVTSSFAHINDIPSGLLKFYWADASKLGGFAYVETRATYMNVTLISGTGDTLYQVVVAPRF